ncbi:hypothetical protein FLJU110815_18915 [Flavobacterium jumunjinense]
MFPEIPVVARPLLKFKLFITEPGATALTAPPVVAELACVILTVTNVTPSAATAEKLLVVYPTSGIVPDKPDQSTSCEKNWKV